jgi:hypothetical protein
MQIEKCRCSSIVFLTFVALILSAGAALAEKIVYNKYNIHTQIQTDRRGNQSLSASYANYTDPGAGHRIIPPGTALVVDKVGKKGITFTVKEAGDRVEFECHEPRMGISSQQYLELITSAAPVSLSGLTKEDQKGIKEGKAFPGMTRNGILVALGYPAAHKTPSLESSSWYYWTNRFKSIAIEFDDRGKVVQVRD